MIFAKILSEGDKFRINLKDGQSFLVDKEDLPRSVQKSGSDVAISFAPSGESAKESQSARLILNELLG